MPRYSDDVSTPGFVRGGAGEFGIGPHGAGNFVDSLRKAQAVIHEKSVEYRVATGVAVASIEIPLVGFLEASEIVAVQVVPEVKSTGGDNYTVDLQKGNGGVAYATVLSAVVTVNSSSANRTAQLATIDPTKKDAAAGDSARLKIISSGTSHTGLVVTVIYREYPQV